MGKNHCAPSVFSHTQTVTDNFLTHLDNLSLIFFLNLQQLIIHSCILLCECVEILTGVVQKVYDKKTLVHLVDLIIGIFCLSDLFT